MPYMYEDSGDYYADAAAGAGGSSTPWLMMAGPATTALTSLIGGAFNIGVGLGGAQSDIAGYQQELYNRQADYYAWLGEAQAAAAQYNARVAEWRGDVFRKIGEFNAQVYEADIVTVEIASKVEAKQIRELGRAVLSTQRAKYASSGVNPGVGSAADVQRDTVDDIALELAVGRYNRDVQIASLKNKAALSRWSGQINGVLADAQATIDSNLADQYLYAGAANAASARLQGEVAGLQQDMASLREKGSIFSGLAGIARAGTSLLAGYGEMQRTM